MIVLPHLAERRLCVGSDPPRQENGLLREVLLYNENQLINLINIDNLIQITYLALLRNVVSRLYEALDVGVPLARVALLLLRVLALRLGVEQLDRHLLALVVDEDLHAVLVGEELLGLLLVDELRDEAVEGRGAAAARGRRLGLGLEELVALDGGLVGHEVLKLPHRVAHHLRKVASRLKTVSIFNRGYKQYAL